MSRTTVHSKKKSEESTSEPSPQGEVSKSSSTPSESSPQGTASTGSTSVVPANEVKSLLAVITAVGGPALALTSKDRRRSVRLRKGGEKVVPTITALSEQFGLNVRSHPVSAITSNLDKAKSLVAVHKQLVTATKHVADAIFKAESNGWEGATVHYTVLKRLAKTDGDLATALAPVSEFFARKSPAVAKAEKGNSGGQKGSQPNDGSTTTTTTDTASAQTQAAPAPASNPPAPGTGARS